MARFRGPKSKISRRFKEAIFGPDKALERRPYGPGQHGNTRRRKKESEYSVQLAEKQKAKYTYGILEKQFSNMFKQANARQGITGEILLQFCESRLDNVVFRLGLANSRRGARQLVSHRHIMVNGHVVSVREKSKSLAVITSSLSAAPKRLEWLDWNVQQMAGTFLSVPMRDQIPENIKESLIVELYSK